VPDNQLSLAIGKEGQNVRLAARLTGWRIDIRSETQIAEMEEAMYAEIDARAKGVTTAPAGTEDVGLIGAEEVGEPSEDLVVGGEQAETAAEQPAEAEAAEAEGDTETEEAPAPVDAADEAEAEAEAEVEAEAEPELEEVEDTAAAAVVGDEEER
jgi:N utilization substance protein A